MLAGFTTLLLSVRIFIQSQSKFKTSHQLSKTAGLRVLPSSSKPIHGSIDLEMNPGISSCQEIIKNASGYLLG